MAKINNRKIYKNIENPSLLDFLLGTKEESGSTKSFPLQSVIQLINGVNGRNNIQYQFYNGEDIDIDYTTTGMFFTDTNQSSPDQFSTLIFNKETLYPIDLSLLFSKIGDLQNTILKLENPEDPNNFFQFKIVSFQNNEDYFSFGVQPFYDFYIGDLINEKIYSLYFDIQPNVNKNDSFTSVGSISLEGNKVTISTGFEWEINGGIYSNMSAYEETVLLSSAGKQRFVVFVANVFNTFDSISGPESTSNPIAPPIPSNVLQATILLVTDGTISQPEPPVLGSEFVKKSEQSPVVIYGGGGGNLSVDNEKAYFEINSYGSSIISIEDQQGYLYLGKEVTFRNTGNSDLVFEHNPSLSEMNKKFFTFPDEESFVLKPDEILKLKLGSNNRLNYVGHMALPHSTTHELGGTDEINGQNLKVQVIPSVINYSPVTETLKGHLNGIDTKLGQLSTTTAGLLSRVFYTSDVVNVNGVNYLKTNFANGGTTASLIQTVSVNDNETQYFAQQLITDPFTTYVLGVRGSYTGQLTVMANPNSALQEFGIEAYRCDNLGIVLPSGVTGAPIGSLGVTVIAIMDSGQIQLDANQVTSLQITGELLSNVTFNAGERIRYRVFARKVGTTGGAINMSVYFGTNYNSYYDTPVQNTTDSSINRSTIKGQTNTDALNIIGEEIFKDAILTQVEGGVVITGLNLSIDEGAFEWRINQDEYLNTPAFSTTLAPATTGFYRSDIVVGTDTGAYQIIQGDESADVAIEPSTPVNTIRLFGLSLFGEVAGPPTPTPTTNFVEKSERANVILTGSGVINMLTLADEKATVVFKGSITRLNTITYPNIPYNGKRITLFNAQNTPVTIGNSVSGFGVDFVFPDGQDYILLPNQTIEFSFDITYFPYAHHMLIGAVVDSQIEINSSRNISNIWNGKTILFTANCTITVPATLPSQYGFVFRTLAGVTITWAITAPFVWETTPTTTPEKTTGSFMRRGSTNTILLDF